MKDTFFNFMAVAKALTDENRVRILMALRERELCVCQVTGFLDLSPSTTSKHLSILRQARLIESRKKGKWVYYSVPDKSEASPMIERAIEWVTEELKNCPVVLEDEQRICEILEKESAFCMELGDQSDFDRYHSLEIHSLASNDEAETVGN